jgi:hypothetical protein
MNGYGHAGETHLYPRARILVVVIPLLAVIAVYSFAVAGELSTAVGLSNAGKAAGAAITPKSKLLVALNVERSLAVGYLSTGSGSGIRALAEHARCPRRCQRQPPSTPRARHRNLRVIASAGGVLTLVGTSTAGPVRADAALVGGCGRLSWQEPGRRRRRWRSAARR